MEQKDNELKNLDIERRNLDIKRHDSLMNFIVQMLEEKEAEIQKMVDLEELEHEDDLHVDELTDEAEAE